MKEMGPWGCYLTQSQTFFLHHLIISLIIQIADAGDSVEDANFDVSSAEAGILRLYTMIEWVKEMLASKETLRSSKKTTFHDDVFVSEMSKRMNETAKNYNDMLFREALRTGFFELQAARDKVFQQFIIKYIITGSIWF